MTADPLVFSEDGYDGICREIRRQGSLKYRGRGYDPIVFTNGCFDILHPGHLQVLFRCRKLAGPRGAVVVGVNSDASVKRLKGFERPFLDEDHRCAVLVSLKYVDHVVSFEEDTPIELIRSLSPNVIVKGGDYKANEVIGHELAYVEIVPIREGFSTTSVLERLKR